MYYILPHVSILLSDININTPCFFKSLTSGVSLSEPSKKEILFNNIIMFTCKTNKLLSLKCISLPHAHWTYATGSLNGSQETLYGLQKTFLTRNNVPAFHTTRFGHLYLDRFSFQTNHLRFFL